MTQKIWTLSAAEALYALPFTELLFQAQTIHRQHFKADEIQLAQLYNIQTGSCPEDCKYCPQSSHYQTDVMTEKNPDLAPLEEALEKAKALGATRFCITASVRNPSTTLMKQILPMLKKVQEHGMETCLTAGMLSDAQTEILKEAGLDYYNHNLDTSPEYYEKIITTRTYDDRLQTLQRVQDAGIKVCSGGILGMGETVADRLKLLLQLANLSPQPQSVPINQLIATPGTPLEDCAMVDPIDFARIIACARIMMPTSYVRLSGNRREMSDEAQTLAFLAGANSMFIGEVLITRKNALPARDRKLLEKLGFSLADKSVCESTDNDC